MIYDVQIDVLRKNRTVYITVVAINSGIVECKSMRIHIVCYGAVTQHVIAVICAYLRVAYPNAVCQNRKLRIDGNSAVGHFEAVVACKCNIVAVCVCYRKLCQNITLRRVNGHRNLIAAVSCALNVYSTLACFVDSNCVFGSCFKLAVDGNIAAAQHKVNLIFL